MGSNSSDLDKSNKLLIKSSAKLLLDSVTLETVPFASKRASLYSKSELIFLRVWKNISLDLLKLSSSPSDKSFLDSIKSPMALSSFFAAILMMAEFIISKPSFLKARWNCKYEGVMPTYFSNESKSIPPNLVTIHL